MWTWMDNDEALCALATVKRYDNWNDLKFEFQSLEKKSFDQNFSIRSIQHDILNVRSYSYSEFDLYYCT